MWKTKLEKLWNENPLLVITVGTMAASTAIKLIDSLSAAQGRRAYARDVAYRTGNR